MRTKISGVILPFLAVAVLAGAPDAAQLNNLGIEQYRAGHYAEAENYLQDALKAWQDGPGQWPTRRNLAAVWRQEGRYLEAESEYLAVARRSAGAERILAMKDLAGLYRALGRIADALKTAREAVRLAGREPGLPGTETAATLHELAAAYRESGNLDEAEALYRRTRDLILASGARSTLLPAVLNNLGEIASARRDYAASESFSRQALALWEEMGSPKTAVALTNLAQALRLQGKTEEAEPLYLRALAILESAPTRDNADMARCLQDLADSYHAQGRETKAVEQYRRALEITEARLGREHPETALLKARLAEVRRAQGRYMESARLYREAMPVLERTFGSGDPRVTEYAALRRRMLSEARNLIVEANPGQ